LNLKCYLCIDCAKSEVPIHNSSFIIDNLLDDLTADFRRHLILPRYAAETLALWNVHTYAYELRDISTYLGIESPDKQCGKTTLLRLLGKLVRRPVSTANVSPSALFRVIEELQPTLLIDEGDTFLRNNDELRGILNAGYTPDTAFVLRASSESSSSSSSSSSSNGSSDPLVGSANNPSIHESITPSLSSFPSVENPTGIWAVGASSNLNSKVKNLKCFSTWCPKAIAMIGRLPETLSDRCITIRMHRKRKSEICDRVREFDGSSLRRRCEEFVHANAEAIRTARPVVPAELGDRAADIWEPLLVLADLAGGQWPELARAAAVFMSAKAQEASPTASLLSDIHALFLRDNNDRLWTRTVVQALNQMTDRPWRDLAPASRVTEGWLSRHLRKYGIFSHNISIAGV
jgi:putative DNA primase/helicase